MSLPKKTIVTAVLLFALGAATAVYLLIVFPNSPGPGQGGKKEVEISLGSGPAQLAAKLHEAGIISNPDLFALWLRATNGFARVKAGRFAVPDNATPLEALSIMSGRGIEKGVKVTVPEGFTLTQIGRALENAGLLEKKEFIAAATDRPLLLKLGMPGPTAEGYLFPDTYFFDHSDSASEIVEAMWNNFKKRVASIRAIKSEDLKKAVTLASIVQAEAKVAEEMPVVAGVYLNRLDSQKFPTGLLQADPSVSYGCEPYVAPQAESCLDFDGTLTRRQLEDHQNPYNTYVHPGLPPGPISAPGLEALKAVVNPAKVTYLYFVAGSNGRHSFSDTYEEHLKAVNSYRKGE